jgi:small subunit ribosomal protein S1
MPTNGTKETSSFAQFLKSEPEIFSVLREGELVEATLMKKDSRAHYFDLGRGGTGIVYGAELMNAKNVLKGLNVGDKINAKVLSLGNDEGYIELSLSQADRQKTWGLIQDLKEKDEVLKVTVTGVNSGGLLAEIQGMKAFLPVSQLSNEHYPRVADGSKEKILEELKKFQGQELSVKIYDFNPRANKLILSEREITDQGVKELLSKYEVGQVIDGLVSGVANFGVFVRFVDNPSIEGLVHISELEHFLVEHPKEVVKVDEAVKAKIIDIKNGRVFLSLKALKPNPWDTIEEKYKAEQEVMGTVYKFNPFGAFINLEDKIQGLIHVSEFGSVDEMKRQLEVGKSYRFIIFSLKPQEKRLILKLKK